MKLVSVRIRNFKSIEDSETFAVDQVTCLVGKNEAGKSAILEAIYSLKPVEQTEKEFTEFDFPRRRISYLRQENQWKDEPALTTQWVLEEHDLAEAAQHFGFQPFKTPNVSISKGYDNVLRVGLDLDDATAIAYYMDNFALNADERAPLIRKSTLRDMIETLAAIAEPTNKQVHLRDELAKTFEVKDVTSPFRSFIVDHIPTIVKFAEYHRLPGRISIDQIKKKPESARTFGEKVFVALLDLANSSINEITSIGTSEKLYMELEAISNRLSDEIFEFWSTNQHLSVEFEYRAGLPSDPPPFNSGFVFETRIKNNRHRVTVNFDERSSGFIWFFSFLVWFSQVRKNYGENLLILLDEPALNLHGKAQADLLRYIDEKLSRQYQVIYTTHSPFMISPDKILSVRTVEDRSEGRTILGTKVGDRPLNVDPDTILPMLGALGIDITQTLFVGAHSLLVVGPSDLLYLKWFSHEMRQRGRTPLDPRWTISPVGGLGKVSSFVALFSGRVADIAVLTDTQHGNKGDVRRLREGELLKKGHVLTLDMYVEQPEADIEDLLGRGTYINLVQLCYNLGKDRALPEQRPEGASVRVVKEVGEHFRVLPPTVPEFDHFTPAAFLTQHGHNLRSLLPGLEEALDRFERLFRDVNNLLT